MASRIESLRKFGGSAAKSASNAAFMAGSYATQGSQALQSAALDVGKAVAKRAATAAAKSAIAATGVGTVGLVAIGLFARLAKQFKKHPIPYLLGTGAVILCCCMMTLINLILAEHVVNPLNWPSSLINTVGCAGFTSDTLEECTFEYACGVVADRVGGNKAACDRFLPDEDEDAPIDRRATLD